MRVPVCLMKQILAIFTTEGLTWNQERPLDPRLNALKTQPKLNRVIILMIYLDGRIKLSFGVCYNLYFDLKEVNHCK